jgi:hypothetical protein
MVSVLFSPVKGARRLRRQSVDPFVYPANLIDHYPKAEKMSTSTMRTVLKLML